MINRFTFINYSKLLPEDYIFIPSLLITVSIAITAARYYWRSDRFSAVTQTMEDSVDIAQRIGKSSVSLTQVQSRFLKCILSEEKLNDIRIDIWIPLFNFLNWILHGVKKLMPYVFISLPILAAGLLVSGAPQAFLEHPLLATIIGFIAMKPAADYAVSVFEWLDRTDRFFREMMKGRKAKKMEKRIYTGILSGQKILTQLKMQTESNPKKQDNDQPQPPENK